MKGLNRAYLLGHIGHEPELHHSPAGLPTLKLSLATPNVRKAGEDWLDSPDWHRITFFGADAEFMARTAHKGDVLAVECTLRPGRWTDKNGEVHYEVSLIVEQIMWLQRKPKS